MARKILIFGHDDAVLRQVAAALASVDGELAVERSAAAARERLAAGEIDLAVIDLDDAGGDGLRLASDARMLAGGIPIVLLAGDERRNSVKRSMCDETSLLVGKPIHAEELRQAVDRAAGGAPHLTPGPAAPVPPAQAGRLADRPVPALLGDLWRRRATGTLEIEAGSFRARIHWQEGTIGYASSSDPRLAAGRAEVAAGTLAAERLEAALKLVRERRIPLPEALRESGALAGEALEQALARQTAAVVTRCCALPAGNWSFFAAPPRLPTARRFHPLALALEGVRRAYPEATLRAWRQRHPAPPLFAPEAEATLRAAAIGATTARAAADLPLLFTLAGFGLVRLDPVAARPPAARHAEGGRPLGAEEMRRIEAEAVRTADATHYEILGVGPDATAEEIKQAYLALAKRWHIDAFAGRDLGDHRRIVEEIFARIAGAISVLGDPSKRAEYDVFLERKAKGLPTDVHSVLLAEELFHKAQRLFRAQRYPDAEALFRQAVELNPAEAEFWAYLGASIYRARGSAAVQESREAFARARALIPGSLVTEYLEAQLEIGEGDYDAAERRLHAILLEKPDHREAARDLRTLRERKEKKAAAGRGFLRPLWKRK